MRFIDLSGKKFGKITINGETKCSSEWERILGICRHTIKNRYLKGVANV